MKKKVLIISVIIIFILLLGIGIFLIIKNKNRVPASNINELQVVDKLEFANGNIIIDNDLYNYSVTVTNPGKKPVILENIMFIFYDIEGKEIVKTIGYIGERVEPGEVKLASVSVDVDIKKANRVEIDVIKK